MSSMMSRTGWCEWRRGAWLLGFTAVFHLGSANAQITNTNTPLPPAPRRPSIILILADDLGYGDLGCYGQTQIKTPNLDQLAAEGLRFTSFYAGSPPGSPSRYALMTGLNPTHAAIGADGTVTLRPEDQTVAELLLASKYRTGMVGKWALGDENSTGMPAKKGFQEFAGFLSETHSHDFDSDHLWRTDPNTHYEGEVVFPKNQGGKKGAYMPDVPGAGGPEFRAH